MLICEIVALITICVGCLEVDTALRVLLLIIISDLIWYQYILALDRQIAAGHCDRRPLVFQSRYIDPVGIQFWNLVGFKWLIFDSIATTNSESHFIIVAFEIGLGPRAAVHVDPGRMVEFAVTVGEGMVRLLVLHGLLLSVRDAYFDIK